MKKQPIKRLIPIPIINDSKPASNNLLSVKFKLTVSDLSVNSYHLQLDYYFQPQKSYQLLYTVPQCYLDETRMLSVRIIHSVDFLLWNHYKQARRVLSTYTLNDILSLYQYSSPSFALSYIHKLPSKR